MAFFYEAIQGGSFEEMQAPVFLPVGCPQRLALSHFMRVWVLWNKHPVCVHRSAQRPVIVFYLLQEAGGTVDRFTQD